MVRLLPLVALLLATTSARAQTILIDHRPDITIRGSYHVRAVEVNATVVDQVAQVQVSQTFFNPGSSTLEAEFLFPLPEDGAIQNLVLLANGKELPGRLLSAEEARHIYESIVRSKRDPALLEFVGRGLFKTSVFPIPAGAERTVTMSYTQLCRRDRDLVEFLYPLTTHLCTRQPIGKLVINLRIESKEPIKSIYSPSHTPVVQRIGEHQANVLFEQHSATPASDFRLFYALSKEAVGATLLSYKPPGGEDGYFMLLASPGFTRPDAKPIAKTVVFVLDKSGSMSGKKIEQARDALRFVMNNLNEGDTFNIVTYDDRVEVFKPELQSYNSVTRDAALAYTDAIHAGGSTNIDGALRAAMAMLQDDKRPTYVLFLTDGLPTAGETNELRIAENAARANRMHARVIGFGVGHDVNARLLDRISHGNSGVSEYVQPEENIEAAVSRFYGRIAAPVLANLKVEIDGVTVNRFYPRDLPDLFEGGQLVYVGRYGKGGRATVKLTGRVGDTEHAFVYPADFAGEDAGPAYGFVEKLWAMRRVGDLIDQIDLHGRSNELVNELVELSKRHGILTPYTAFLADEDVKLGDVRVQRERAQEDLLQLAQVSGDRANAQRKGKAQYLRAESAPAGAPALSSVRFATEAKDVAADKEAQGRIANVRQVGGKTFFNKAGVWQDSDVTDEETAKAQVVRQFSDEHMELNRRLRADQRQFVSFDEAVLVKLDGKVYRIEKGD